MQSEIEHCKYYFDVADVDGLKQTYDTYERESQRALAAGLVVPSYDYVLKCSHLFNVLDTRGAIGVTERATYFRRMAAMTRNVAKAYLEYLYTPAGQEIVQPQISQLVPAIRGENHRPRRPPP